MTAPPTSLQWPPLPLDASGALHVSVSQLDKFKTCPTFWGYQYLFRRERVAAPVPRAAGKALHAALEARYTGKDTTTQEQALVSGFAGMDMSLDEYRTPARFLDVLRGYNQTWQKEPFTVLGAELGLSVPLGTVTTVAGTGLRRDWPIILDSVIDLLVRWESGEVFVMDTKTMNRWGDMQLVQWENAGAPKGYAWAVQEARRLGLRDDLPERVHGFCLNAVVIRPPLKRTSVAGDGLPRTEYHRHRCYYSQAHLEEWRANTLLWVETLLRYVAAGAFPMNERSCANHYGARCPFLDVCSVPPEQRELVLATDLFQDYVRGGPLGEAAAAEETP